MPGSSRATVALLGFGGSGAGIHAPLLETTDAVDLAVIVTRDPERRATAAARYPTAEVTDSLDPALGCDVAVVALPVAFRGDMVLRLLDRGVRVIVEKPFANDLGESKSLAAVAGDRVAVFHNRRWDSDFLTLRRLQDEGAWTGPVKVTSRIQRWQPAVRDGWRNRPDGGGFLREVGTHQIDQVLVLFGPASSVYAEISTRRDGAGAEDDVFLSIAHADGSRSHVVSSAVGDPTLPRFDLASDETLVSLGAADPQQDQLAVGLSPADPEWGRADASDWWIRRGSGDRQAVTPERGWWPGFYEAVDAWVTGGVPPVSGAEAVATMAVIEAARRSALEGVPVLLDGV